MAAIYYGFFAGTITDNPLGSGATTVNSAALAALPALTGSDFFWAVLDPEASAGTPEIVKVTAHTAAATVCTVTRGQQTTQGGSAARSHVSGTKFIIPATPNDFDDLPHRLMTAKGDLISATAANTSTRVGVGTNSHVLQADSAQAPGIKWGQVATAGITDANVTAVKLAADTAGLGLSQNGGTKALDVNVDGVGLEINVDTLRIKDQGVVTAKILDQAVTEAKLQGGTTVDGVKWKLVQPFASGAAAATARGSGADVGEPNYLSTNDSQEGMWFWNTNNTALRKQWNIPWGRISHAIATASQTGITTTITDLTSLTVTFTASANRYYLIRGHITAQQNSAATAFEVRVTDGSNTQIASCDQTVIAGQALSTSVAVVVQPAAGSVTYKLRGLTNTGTADLIASAASPILILVEDIGPSGAPGAT
jgi:hypothetical protein